MHEVGINVDHHNQRLPSIATLGYPIMCPFMHTCIWRESSVSPLFLRIITSPKLELDVYIPLETPYGSDSMLYNGVGDN